LQQPNLDGVDPSILKYTYFDYSPIQLYCFAYRALLESLP